MADFWVLLGTDYCGKSSVLEALADGRSAIHPVSYDRHMLPEEYAPHAGLHALLGTALRDGGGTYSGDFVLSLLQVGVVYLRDRALAGPAGRTVLLDSYYYKVLAKCRLLGLDGDRAFRWWRTFPQPRGVVLLDVDPADAWRRSGEGALLNPMEHYGTAGTRAEFLRFQADLRDLLLDEVARLPVVRISVGGDVAATTAAVARAVGEPGLRETAARARGGRL
ncbi:hypothetical protein ACFY97_18070 [Streptomyces klenkii]|uniref:hypothetical protein n=1 Tax=Streptomyces klenkii TaxID=1420899 RepID=UPI0036E61686